MNYDDARPELIWPGKYDERGGRRPVRLPAEIPRLRLREAYGAEERRDLLIWGDNKLALAALLERLRGQVDLIYIDPPFDVGADFTMQVQVGQHGRSFSFESVAYRDVWGTGVDSYLHMMFERLTLLRELLSERGSIYLHCDWRVSAYLRCLLNEIFGPEQFRNEIAWSYRTGGASKRSWSQKHDTILFYSKTAGYTFNQQREKSYTKSKSRRPGVINYGAGTAEFFEDEQGVYTWVNARAVWELPYINSQAAERLAFPTQKPEALLERIIAASSNPGDLVLDAFCGSGTTLAAAQRLGRRWIGVDLGRRAIQTATKRLSALGCSFDLCDLEDAEWPWWARRLEARGHSERALVLERYGATPIDHPLLHGERGGALIYVASNKELVSHADLLHLAAAVDGRALHCLASAFERDLPYKLGGIRAELGLDIRLVQIPRELMEPNRGAVTFFELGMLEVEIVGADGGVVVELLDFYPPLPATPLRGVEALRECSPFDLIDWWAVDVDWDDDRPFAPQWQAYRTRADRSLPLRSAVLPAAPGDQIRVKVVDVFGQETFVVVVV